MKILAGILGIALVVTLVLLVRTRRRPEDGGLGKFPEQLVYVRSADDVVSARVMFTAARSAKPVAVLWVHGWGANFYRPGYVGIGRALAGRGFTTISVNTRMHDPGNVEKYGAFEKRCTGTRSIFNVRSAAQISGPSKSLHSPMAVPPLRARMRTPARFSPVDARANAAGSGPASTLVDSADGAPSKPTEPSFESIGFGHSQTLGFTSYRLDGRPPEDPDSPDKLRTHPESRRTSAASFTASGGSRPLHPFRYTSRQEPGGVRHLGSSLRGRGAIQRKAPRLGGEEEPRRIRSVQL